jgi:hypothetical protein
VTKEEIENVLANEYDLSVESIGPTFEVADTQRWLTYNTTLRQNEKRIWSGDYHMGTGHVKLVWKPRHSFDRLAMTPCEESMFYAAQKNPYVNFKDQETYGSMLVKVAKANGLKPHLVDVVWCLLMDGEPWFSGLNFPEWCNEYGHNDDSIKAKSVYEACLEAGRVFFRTFTSKELDDLRQLFVDY